MAKAITIFTNEYTNEAVEAITEFIRECGDEAGRDFDEEPITDEEISEHFAVEQDENWDLVKAELDGLFGDSKVLMTGTVGRWNGDFPGGSVGDFDELLADLLTDCNEATITEKRGRLYIEGVHHDGRVRMEVRLLTEAGENAWRDWEYDYRFGNLTEREMHERLYKSRRYTKAPYFTKNVWGR